MLHHRGQSRRGSAKVLAPGARGCLGATPIQYGGYAIPSCARHTAPGRVSSPGLSHGAAPATVGGHRHRHRGTWPSGRGRGGLRRGWRPVPAGKMKSYGEPMFRYPPYCCLRYIGYPVISVSVLPPPFSLWPAACGGELQVRDLPAARLTHTHAHSQSGV